MKKKTIKCFTALVLSAMVACIIPQQALAKDISKASAVNINLKAQENINVGAADLVINSAREMNEFAVKVNNSGNGYSGRVIKLGKDIVYTGIDNYTPINNFQGTFDGCGHTIKGIQVMETGNVGVFASTNGAVIKNVTIEDCNFTTTGDCAGGIVGYAYSTTVKNCHNVGTTVSGVFDTGGIVGWASRSIVLNCSSGGVIEGYRTTGGIAGVIDTIYNSCNTGQVKNKYSDCYVGGIAGDVSTIINCYNTGTVSGGYAGGIAGSVDTKAVANYCAEEAADFNFYKMSGQESGNEAMPLSQMKTDSFVQKLNNNLGSTHDDWLQWQGGNSSSYPQHIPLVRMEYATVTLAATRLTYNGQNQCPKVKVSVAGTTLVEGRDYGVYYSNCKNPGTATVSVAGLGRYVDSVEISYEILPLDLKKAKITLSQESYYYDGEAKTPQVTVSLDGVVIGKWSEEDEDDDWYDDEDDDEDDGYTPSLYLSFKNNVNPGTATVTVTGSDKYYTGTVNKTFKILKQNQSIVTSGNYSKTDKDANFYIGAYRTQGDGALNFKSSNSSVVSVNSSTGYVVIKGPGRAIITITAKATTGYNQKQEQIIVNVKPQKQSVTLKKGKGRTMSLKWIKDRKVTGYILQYGTDRSFKKNTKEINLKKSTVASKKISKLKKGKTYYVRVRSYKTMKVNGKMISLNGSWSKVVSSGKIK